MAGRRKKTGRRWALPRPDWPEAMRILTGATWLLAAAALVVAWAMGVPRLEAYASRHQPPDDVAVRFASRPAWAKGDLEATLLSAAARHISSDPLPPDGLVAAREALMSTGWFEEIPQVRRVNARLVEINARFAQPFAVIREAAEATDYLVDSRGRLLPRSFPAGEAGRFTVLVGTQHRRPARPGEPWPGADVTAALKVLHLIDRRPWRGQVAEVDVAQYDRRKSIRLITERGCTIVWGRPPGEEHGGEVPAPQKLRYLEYHHEQYGHIDRGFLRELDITGDVVIGR